jgi:hypothetical protein
MFIKMQKKPRGLKRLKTLGGLHTRGNTWEINTLVNVSVRAAATLFKIQKLSSMATGSTINVRAAVDWREKTISTFISEHFATIEKTVMGTKWFKSQKTLLFIQSLTLYQSCPCKITPNLNFKTYSSLLLQHSMKVNLKMMNTKVKAK